MGDHTESLQIDYDPKQISFDEILEIFWDSHNPLTRPFSRQYMAIIFYDDDEQETIVRRSKEKIAAQLGQEPYTEIQALDRFYLAEDYHQKYYLQQIPALYTQIRPYYDDFSGLVDSTVAARLNGLVGGHGDTDLIEEEVSRYGLNEDGLALLETLLR